MLAQSRRWASSEITPIKRIIHIEIGYPHDVHVLSNSSNGEGKKKKKNFDLKQGQV